MRTITIDLAAGQNLKLDLIGTYFHLLDTTAPVDIEFLRNGGVFATAKAMEFGFFSKPEGGFEALGFFSAVAQSIKIAVGIGDGGYNRTTGSVQIIGQADTFYQSAATVTNASAQLLAANAARKLLMIQNNDSVGNVYVCLDGTAATTAKGIKIEAGASLILDVHVPASAIFAIGDIASNPNVVVVES